MIRAKLARFYGWTHDQVSALGVHEANLYWKAITALEAQELIISFKSANWPNVQAKSKQKILNDLKKVAYPSEYKSGKRDVTTKELADILSRR